MPYLLEEINRIKPEIIVAVGDTALEALIGENEITKYRGYTIPYKHFNCIILPVVHPAAVLRDFIKYEYCFKNDLKKLLTYKSITSYDLNDYVENHIILQTSELPTFIKTLKKLKKFAIDFETKKLKPFNTDSKLLTVGIATSGIQSYSFDLTPENESYLIEILSLPNIKIIQNFKFEQIWAWIKLNCIMDITTIHDTMLFAYLLNETKGTHSLDFQSFVRMGLRKLHEAERYKDNMEECPLELRHTYCGLDAKLAYRLDEILHEELKRYKKLMLVYTEILLKGSIATLKSEIEGVLIDEGVRSNLEKFYAHKMENTIKKIYALPEIKAYKEKEEKFNINSIKDVKNLLQNHLKLEPIKLTNKKSYSVDAEVLEHFSHNNAFCKLLLEYRDIGKVSSTYLKGITKFIYEDGKLHTNYNMHGTETGRFCVAKGTLIDTIRDISKFPNGIPIEDVKANDLVYTFDKNNDLTIKKVKWAGKTGFKKVIRIHWIGQGRKHKGYLDVTPEHLVKTLNGFIPAITLKPNDRIFALSRSLKTYSYIQATGMKRDSKREHVFIYKILYNKENECIHHKDGNKLNHTPNNLQEISRKKHSQYHSTLLMENPKRRKLAAF